MERLRYVLVQIFCTKLGWLLLTLFLSIVFGVLANYIDWCEYAMFICLSYPVGLTLVMMVYGWIINPIREWKKIKQMKEQYKKDNQPK